MPFIPKQAVSTLDTGVEVGCPRVHAGATTTTTGLIVELKAVNLNHTATNSDLSFWIA